MGKINLLDKLTIDQIAAGEVIERPSSVVKEMTENSIDAGASAITVEIGGGGIDLIRITDNGSGIEKSDLHTAFMRHATSKIRDASDLLKISSLGFRGEALSSIASVAKVEVITKTRNDFTGTRLVIEGGDESAPEDVGCPDGTTFIVRDLFYNVPARRKFLKTAMTEAGYISELLERMALSHPEVSFKLINKGMSSLYTSGNRNLKDVIYNIFGRNITSELVPLVGVHGSIMIDGYIAKPSISRGNRNYENYFVNGRYVKNSLITKAIEEAFKPYTMQHRFPFTAFRIDLPADMLDVNVHPTKLEVRFADGESVYRAVFHTITDALSGRNLIGVPGLEETVESAPANDASPSKEAVPAASTSNVILPKNEDYGSEQRKPLLVRDEADKSEINPKGRKTLFFDADTEQSGSAEPSAEQSQISEPLSVKSSVPVQQELELEEKEDYKLIGQIFGTYWLIERKDVFYMIDQHAAHEKVIYERLVKSFNERKVNSQNILPPMVVSLSRREEETLKKHEKEFELAGFAIENFGGKEYVITAVPCELFGLTSEDLFKEILDNMADVQESESRNIILEKLATMSCKAAIKGNMWINESEAHKLISELMTLENPYFCPHGRPTIIAMTKQEIERKFKRIVN